VVEQQPVDDAGVVESDGEAVRVGEQRFVVGAVSWRPKPPSWIRRWLPQQPAAGFGGAGQASP
jgi:hypothetical protein